MQNVEYWEDYEVLTVETPENLELKLPLAGFGPRFLALLVDQLIQAAVLFVLLIIAIFGTIGMAPGGEQVESAMLTFIVVIIIIAIGLYIGYPLLFELIWNGQTPGKRVTGIRVVKRGGLPLIARDVILRNLMRLVDYLPSGFTGMISFFATKYQQRLGDLVADTVVVREFTTSQPYVWAYVQDSSVDASGALTPQMSYVIGSYLSRAPQLPADVRYFLTDEIIRQLGYEAKDLSQNERDAYLASLLQYQPGGGG